MRTATVAVCLLSLIFAGCGGGGGGGGSKSTDPAGATELSNFLRAELLNVLLAAGRVNEALPDQKDPILLNPAGAGAVGIAFSPDPGPGAPPNSYVFDGLLDWYGKGPDTSVSGTIAFNVPPAGEDLYTLEIDLEINIVIQNQTTFVGEFDLMYGPTGLTGSGTGHVDNTFSGNEIDITVDPASPVTVGLPDGPPDSVSNSCRYSVQGPVKVEVSGPSGIYSAIWSFLFNSTTVTVSDRTFDDGTTGDTDLSDTSFKAGNCGGMIEDWVGTYALDWECDPPESGTSTMEVTVTGPNRVHFRDTDAGSGEVIEFDGTADPGNPHVVHGTFFETTYREDFTYTLNEESNLFNKRSTWVYISGPDIGKGGTCQGMAPKLP